MIFCALNSDFFKKITPRLPRGEFFFVYGKRRKLLLYRINADFFAVFAETLKANLTVNKSEKSVVLAFAYVCAGMDFCSSLSYKDVACKNILTVGALCTESFGFGITAVTGRTHTFFMSK